MTLETRSSFIKLITVGHMMGEFQVSLFIQIKWSDVINQIDNDTVMKIYWILLSTTLIVKHNWFDCWVNIHLSMIEMSIWKFFSCLIKLRKWFVSIIYSFIKSNNYDHLLRHAFNSFHFDICILCFARPMFSALFFSFSLSYEKSGHEWK